MKRGATSKDAGLTVFDDVERTSQDQGQYSANSFESLNRNPRKSAELARSTLEHWFSRFPHVKQKDIRGRLRGDDRAHSGALLELLIHELLMKLCQEVTVDPPVTGGRSDFLAVCKDTNLMVECTVAQESDKEFGTLRRERAVLDIIDAVDAGPYKFMVEPQRVGLQQPPRAPLTKYLEAQLASLGADGGLENYAVGQLLDRSIVWKWDDWCLRFQVIVTGDDSGHRAVGGRHSGPIDVVSDKIIARALERKAEAYRDATLPYLVVLAQREGVGNEEDLMDALLPGVYRGFGLNYTGPTFNGFFGSSRRPRNQHVSAVLNKRSLRSVWDIPNQWTTYDYDTKSSHQPPNWTLVHHPAALNPLPHGIFPFAVEHVWRSDTATRIDPTRTLNAVLGLPDPWPGEER